MCELILNMQINTEPSAHEGGSKGTRVYMMRAEADQRSDNVCLTRQKTMDKETHGDAQRERRRRSQQGQAQRGVHGYAQQRGETRKDHTDTRNSARKDMRTHHTGAQTRTRDAADMHADTKVRVHKADAQMHGKARAGRRRRTCTYTTRRRTTTCTGTRHRT